LNRSIFCPCYRHFKNPNLKKYLGNLNDKVQLQGYKFITLQRFPAAKMHVYEVRPRKDRRGVNLVSDALPFGRLWYGETNAAAHAIGYAKHRSRSHDVVNRVYDAAGNVIETHEHTGASSESRRQSVFTSYPHVQRKLFGLLSPKTRV
jgi:hypothetical protein